MREIIFLLVTCCRISCRKCLKPISRQIPWNNKIHSTQAPPPASLHVPFPSGNLVSFQFLPQKVCLKSGEKKRRDLPSVLHHCKRFALPTARQQQQQQQQQKMTVITVNKHKRQQQQQLEQRLAATATTSANRSHVLCVIQIINIKR